MRAVVSADTKQPPEDVGHVAAEQAAVCVQLVDDDDLQLFEQLEPFGVVGQDRGMEHVRVRHDHLARRSDRRADWVRRIPVVGGSIYLQPRSPAELAQLSHLVLTQGLSGEEEESPSRRIFGKTLQDRQQVAQRLARSGRRDHDDVVPGTNRLDRLCLVGVEVVNTPRSQSCRNTRVQPGWNWHDSGRPGRHDCVVSDAARKRRFRQDQLEDSLDPSRFVVAHAADLKPNVRAKRAAILAASASVCRG